MAAPTAPVPWRTVMRERALVVPREQAWALLLDRLGADADDLSVEPPWRHVRRLSADGIDRVEQTVTLRDDGATSHAAWCVGLTAEVGDADADRLLDDLAAGGEALLHHLEAAAHG